MKVEINIREMNFSNKDRFTLASTGKRLERIRTDMVVKRTTENSVIRVFNLPLNLVEKLI
jgi:hypothetical protein